MGSCSLVKTRLFKIALSHFMNIYSSSRPNRISEATAGLCPKVSAEMNRRLTRPFSEDEIKKATFSIGPNTALGQDGMTGILLHANWEVLKENVCEAAAIIPIIISAQQSAFTKGRIILDNILLAHELTHQLKTKRGRFNFDLALKLDMSKAYKRVEWGFVKRVLWKLGFNHIWICWIMNCITSVSYSVNFNGASHGFIWPLKGFRQGDRLSLFLFLLCARCFSSLIAQAELNDELSGVQISWRSPRVFHLLFADDSLRFFKASLVQVQKFQHVLKFRNTPEGLRAQLAAQLRVSNVGGHDKYLGLPVVVCKSKAEMSREICAKVRQKVTGWKENLLFLWREGIAH
ncbi:uncharacterized protein LOC126657026 [Mercurialis annua]|uniref:uncharacterized protein LOC126657026 n=1 Tax=Mercurialis annua TaxID=3986 RepID=UPI00215F1366|nr:uncharacterized protein LOC126657026 [Mercurialis annua]